MNGPHTTDAASRAETLAMQGRVTEAFELLTRAEGEGDALAALTLADWRMSGGLIRRDLDEARRLFGRAAELGIDEAEPIYIAMLANGAGNTGRHWREALERTRARAARDPLARRQVALLEAMELDQEGDPLTVPRRDEIHRAPLIERLPGFLTLDECRYIAELSVPRLAPAVVIDPGTGRQMLDPVRSALSVGFPFVDEDPVLHAINRRIAAATQMPCGRGEPMQVLSYEAGQEYKLHSDTLPGGEDQRVATFLVALSEGYVGGETSFPRLGLELAHRTGDALFFVNTDQAGRPDKGMWHAGRPVTQGRKLLLSQWIRARPLDLSGPPGRPF